MADSETNRSGESGRGRQELARQERDRGRLQRWGSSVASPFDWMDRVTDEMDRMFDRMSRDLGIRSRFGPSRGFVGAPSREGIWSPRVEAFHKGDRFIVRTELPGLKKEDVQVELTDDALTIRGERHEEREEEREGYYHSEREYGQFHRTIPLPEGVIGESAEASFSDGVLEIRMQAAPSEANRGRKLEIRDASQSEKK